MTSIRDILREALKKKILGEQIVVSLRRMRVKFYQISDMLVMRYHWTLLNAFQTFRRRPSIVSESESYHRMGKRMYPQAEIIVNSAITTRETINRDRTKPHVLFVTEKWCDCKPEHGPTNSKHNLFGSLEASGLATQDWFHFDEYYYQHGYAGDAALLARCMDSKPDLLILTWIPSSPDNPKPYNPKLETLNIVRRKMGIPIAGIWFDSVCPKIMHLAELVLPVVDLNVVLDSTAAYLKRTRHPEKYLPMWTPQDPRIFYNPNVDRNIGVSFVGSMRDYPDRRAGIAALRLNGVDVYQAGGQREHRLSIDKYVCIYMRSKIVLNFCLGRATNQVQAKGRIFEITLCGAMLLEAENPETAQWFEPMVDYVPFTNETDLVEKTKYYLEHDMERMEIAARGHQKAKEKYTGEMFWRAIFDRLLGAKL